MIAFLTASASSSLFLASSIFSLGIAPVTIVPDLGASGSFGASGAGVGAGAASLGLSSSFDESPEEASPSFGFSSGLSSGLSSGFASGAAGAGGVGPAGGCYCCIT